VSDFAAGVSLRNVLLDLVIGFAVDKVAGKTLDLLVDVAGPVLMKQAMKFGKGWRKGAKETPALRAKAAAKPKQGHHLGTKYGEWGEEFEKIAGQYGFSLDDFVREMHHSGRHPAEYHEAMLKAWQDADKLANGDPFVFYGLILELLDDVEKHATVLLPEAWR